VVEGEAEGERSVTLPLLARKRLFFAVTRIWPAGEQSKWYQRIPRAEARTGVVPIYNIHR
jgi:hypothetical protein